MTKAGARAEKPEARLWRAQGAVDRRWSEAELAAERRRIGWALFRHT